MSVLRQLPAHSRLFDSGLWPYREAGLDCRGTGVPSARWSGALRGPLAPFCRRVRLLGHLSRGTG
jgi:hypothetical protein